MPCFRLMLLTLLLSVPALVAMGEEEEGGLPVLTPEQVERYQFKRDNTRPEITDLSVSQRYTLSGERREIKDILARRLGIMGFEGEESDLASLQQLCDRKVLASSQVKEWQSLGVMFGDILANKYNLHWVNYRDSLGSSRALQWKDTSNFVFPVTVFSKRVQFGEEIDVRKIYAEISADVERFIKASGSR